MFNITNNGKVGAKKVRITLKNGSTVIPRFHEGTARGEPFFSDPNKDYNLQIPVFHKNEIIPPNFHYETLLGRMAALDGNEKLTEPFVLVIRYQSSLPLVNLIPYVGCFKEQIYINPRMFADLMGTSNKEQIDIDLKLTNNGTLSGKAIRKYPN